MSNQTITKPAVYVEWPQEDGITIVDSDELLRSWSQREGPENIARHWQHAGPVLDPAWLAANLDRFDDDALISLWVDCCSFAGGADLSAVTDVMADRMVALYEAGEPKEWRT